MKKILVIIICISLMFTNVSYADYVIDTSNSIIENNFIKDTVETVEETNINLVNVDSIRNALDEVRYNYKQDYSVYIVDYQMHSVNALGLALDNKIILFDFIPYELDLIYKHTVVHELGHLVYMSMTDEQQEEYKTLRGMPKEWDNYPKTNYINRPQEIFAEDFRVLFGGEDASYLSHFNQELKQPQNIRGLKRFIRQFEKEGEE